MPARRLQGPKASLPEGSIYSSEPGICRRNVLQRHVNHDLLCPAEGGTF